MNRNGPFFAMPRIGMAFSALVLFLLCAASATAQASRVGATLQGAVIDSSGAVIRSAKVTLNNSLTHKSRTVTTDEQGFFRAEQLAVGTYEVRVERIGFAAYEQAVVVLGRGDTVRLNITLNPGSGPVATPNHPPIHAYIEEFFLSEAVRNEDPGDLQVTFSSDARRGLGSNLILEMEYGLTRRLQLSWETAYGLSTTANNEQSAGWSTTSLGLQCQIIRSDWPFALTAGMSFGIPVKPGAERQFEPELLAAKTLGKVQVHASFVADLEGGRPSFEYNLASVYTGARRWFPTLEFNGRHLDGQNAFYVTPGLYRHFSHRLEIGMGLPTAVGGAAGRIGVVGKMTWEIGLDRD